MRHRPAPVGVAAAGDDDHLAVAAGQRPRPEGGIGEPGIPETLHLDHAGQGCGRKRIAMGDGHELLAFGELARRQRLVETIGRGIGPERALTAETTARPLFDLPFVAIFPPDHALARLNRVTWKDALAYPMISLRGEYTRRLSADLQAVHPELMLEPVHEVAFMTTAISMVKAGQGITTALPYGLSIIEQGQLVEPTGTTRLTTGGRPAQLFRFRREVLPERPAPGLRYAGR